MTRLGGFAVLAIAVISCWSCSNSTAVKVSDQSTVQDQSEIYKIFLTEWIGTEHKPLNVSRTAEPPSTVDIKDFSECAVSGTEWTPPSSASDITSQIRQVPFVQPVDSESWKPEDPADLIARGHSVKSAVDSGISHGLMTLSTVVFDTKRHIAALNYSFVCGGLCGNGGTALFMKTSHGWSRSKKRCRSWIS
jgi:hypothetical protein